MSDNELDLPPLAHEPEEQVAFETKAQDQADTPNLPHPLETLEPAKRVRTLTNKGLELYNANRSEHLSRLAKLWDAVLEIIGRINTCAGNMKSLRQIDEDLRRDYDKYRQVQTDMLAFFKSTNSTESIRDMEGHVQTTQEILKFSKVLFLKFKILNNKL